MALVVLVVLAVGAVIIKDFFFELRPVIDPFQPGIDAEFGGQKPVIGGVRPGIISYINSWNGMKVVENLWNGME